MSLYSYNEDTTLYICDGVGEYCRIYTDYYGKEVENECPGCKPHFHDGNCNCERKCIRAKKFTKCVEYVEYELPKELFVL